MTLGERLRSEIAGSARVTEVTISSGVACAPVHAIAGRDLFQRANQALLRAKAGGKNRVFVFKDERSSLGPDLGAANIAGWLPRDPFQERRVVDRDMRSVAQIEVMHDLSDKLSQAQDQTTIGQVVREGLRDVGYHRCRLYLVDDTGTALIPLASDVDADANPDPADHPPIPIGAGVVGRAVASKSTVNIEGNSGCELSVVAERSGGTESSLAVPLRHGDRVTGAVGLCKRGAGRFDRDDERMVEIVAFTAALALENARLRNPVTAAAGGVGFEPTRDSRP